MKQKISELKSNNKSKFGVLVVAVVAAIGVLMFRQTMAATGLYLTGPTSVQKGAEITVSLRLNTSTPVDGVEATLKYDPNILQYVAVDDANSAFPIFLQQTGGNGVVSVIRGKLDGQASGDLFVANVRFKAVTQVKKTTIGLTGNATSIGTYINPLATGMNVQVTKPPRSGGKHPR